MFSRIDYDFQRAAKFTEGNHSQKQLDLPGKAMRALTAGTITTAQYWDVMHGRQELPR